MSTTSTPEPTLHEALGDVKVKDEEVIIPDVRVVPKSEDKPPEVVPKPAEKPVEKSDEEIAKELFPSATAEDLAAIEADPKLKMVRDSMVKDYKGKTGSVADERRKLAEDKATHDQERADHRQAVVLFDALRDDPDGVIKKLAEKRNMTVAEVKREVVEAETDQDVIELFGDNADEAKPVFDRAVEKRAVAVVDARMKPVLDFMAADAEEKAKGEIDLTLSNFAAERKEAGDEITEEIEKRMMELTSQLDPAPRTSYKSYIENIYKIAVSGRSVAEVTKEVTERMERAARGKEPTEIPSSVNVQDSDIPEGTELREALAIAHEKINK